MKRLCLLVFFLVMAIVCFFPLKTFAGIGLEVEDYKNLRVEIKVSKNDLGLTNSEVQTKVELRLREAELNPKEMVPLEPVLGVFVDIVEGAFSVSCHFYRLVDYDVGDETFCCPGITWYASRLGNHHGDTNFILENLDMVLDYFLDEYLKTNR